MLIGFLDDQPVDEVLPYGAAPPSDNPIMIPSPTLGPLAGSRIL